MKACLFYGPEDLRYEEIEKPVLQDGEILVKVNAALTGGTDVKTYLNGHPRIIKKTPSSFGYEFSGQIVDLGPGITNFRYGDRVISANTAPCGECFHCQRNELSLCENLDFLNGSFAEFIKIPAAIVKKNFYKMPVALDFHEAAMAQTLAVCLHGYRRTDIKVNDNVVVYGLGPIGQTFIKILKSSIGHRDTKVIALGRSEIKRKLAKKNGADYVLDTSDKDFKKEFKKICPRGADKVIEATGSMEVWEDTFNLVRRGGLINFFGGCPKGKKIKVDTYKLHYDEVRTIGVFHHTPEFIKEALDLLGTKKIDMKDLITHEMPLEKLEDALKLMIKGEAMKVLIRDPDASHPV